MAASTGRTGAGGREALMGCGGGGVLATFLGFNSTAPVLLSR